MTGIRLAHIEWLKTRRRAAFWTATLFYFGLMTLTLIIAYVTETRQGRAPITLPGDWVSFASGIGGIAGFILSVLVVLLIASERTWRTERQNIIDGLSRAQYFTAKVILVIGLSLLLWLGSIAIVSVFGLMGRQVVPGGGALMDRLAALLLTGFFMKLLLLASVAFFFATVCSGSGAALAFVLLFTVVQDPIAALLASRGGALHAIAAWLPGRITDALTASVTYRPEVLATARAEAAQHLAAGDPGFMTLRRPAAIEAFAAAVAYSVAFLAVSWAVIRRRDL